jgi:hypothetical protein
LKFVLFISRSWEICVNVSPDKKLVRERSKERERGWRRGWEVRKYRREKQGGLAWGRDEGQDRRDRLFSPSYDL